MEETELTLEEAAAQLGVHYMTVYRRLRTGRLPAAHRDGRWYVRAADLAPGPGADEGARRAGRGATDRMVGRLLAGDGHGAWLIVEEALLSGGPREVHLRLLGPALRTIGDGWEADRISVADEHRATAVALGIMGRLAPLFARRGRPRPISVLLAGAEGDPHAIPVMMVGDVLRSEGFQVVQLGADLPAESLLAAAVTSGCHAVGLSASTSDGLERAAATIDQLRLRLPGTPVLLGGPAVTSEEVAVTAGADGWAADAAGTGLALERLTSPSGASAARAGSPVR